MIRQAEANKAKMLEVPGTHDNQYSRENVVRNLNQDRTDLLHSVIVDDQYALVSTHIDEATRAKIIDGQYVDFSKLIPQDKVRCEEEKRMEFVNKNGQTYLMPVSERDTVSILSFHKWEQAFSKTTYSIQPYHLLGFCKFFVGQCLCI